MSRLHFATDTATVALPGYGFSSALGGLRFDAPVHGVALAWATTRAGMAWLTGRRLIVIASVFVFAGIGGSILTTSEPTWWRLYFSELGVYATPSGRAFNATMTIVGLLIALLGSRVGAGLRRDVTFACHRSARIIAWATCSLGVHLTIVGLVPANTWTFLHDRAASGITLSFVVALVAASCRLRRLPRQARVATVLVIASLAATIPLFAVGIVNLTVLEAVGFVGIFGWFTTIVWALEAAPGRVSMTPDVAAVIDSGMILEAPELPPVEGSNHANSSDHVMGERRHPAGRRGAVAARRRRAGARARSRRGPESRRLEDHRDSARRARNIRRRARAARR